ncbi:MAG: class I SAM-dependent DNA methyltransferase [Thermoplasmata archaeon]
MAKPPRGPYGRFARYYDLIYHGLVDYEGDVDFLEAVFRRLSQHPRTILDLGCGTGNHDLPLARRGYEVTGIDRSTGMLALARKKAATVRGPRPRFMRAEMRQFRLDRTFDATICMFGAIGYLLTSRDFTSCLRSVRAHLRPQGLFIFEFWQGSAAKPAPHRSWIHLSKRGLQIVRLDEGRFDPRTGRLPIDFDFFVFRGDRLLDRFAEHHTIRTHSVRDMRVLLRWGGFDLLAAYAATNVKKGFEPATKKTFRVMAVARSRGES